MGVTPYASVGRPIISRSPSIEIDPPSIEVCEVIEIFDAW